LLGRVLKLVAPIVDPALSGFVDRMIGDEVLGWAFDTRRPQRRVLVVARLDNRVVAEALADLPRRDLAAAGRGDGRCGFRLRLPGDLAVDDRIRLRIEAVAGLRRRVLKRGRRFRQELSDPAPHTAVESKVEGPNVGYLERCLQGVLRGWAVNPNNPETPPEVDIFDGEIFLGSVQATEDRPRLRESGAPFGARGFEFTLPDSRDVAAERIRARISGTRFDLRNSRSYPGEGGGRAQARAEARAGSSSPARAAGPTAPPIRPRPNRIGLIVIGDGPAEAIETTLQSWRRQSWPDTASAVLSGHAPSGTEAFAPEDDAPLRAWLANCHSVVFLAPGQIAAPQLAAVVAETPLEADIVVWPGESAQPLGADPRLAVRLHGRTAGLAVRSPALADWRCPDPDEGLSTVVAWALEGGWRWASGETPLAGPATVELPTPPSPPVRRLTLAIWNGWEAEPAALAALLGAAAGRDVEVLVPADASVGLRLSPRAPGARSLAIRVIDVPHELGPVAVLDAFGRAATGQVVVFCDGRLSPDAAIVAEAVRWAAEPGVGAVGPALAHAGFELAGLTPGGAPAACGGVDRPAFAVPAAFFAISRRALAEIEPADLSGPSPELELAGRLAAAGRSSIALGRSPVPAPAEVMEPWRSAWLASARP
jgi:hypothetical protein